MWFGFRIAAVVWRTAGPSIERVALYALMGHLIDILGKIQHGGCHLPTPNLECQWFPFCPIPTLATYIILHQPSLVSSFLNMVALLFLEASAIAAKPTQRTIKHQSPRY